jgi:NAD+ synthase
VILPCYSHPQDEEDARLVASAFSIPVARVDLGLAFDAVNESLATAVKGLPRHVESVDIKQQLPEANLKPRLRMTAIYFIANSLNYHVAGTGNRSEIALGYFTKYGDGGVDVLPIGGLLKSEVRALARELGVPERIITKPPTAGLWVGQTDEAEMGFTYDTLEAYLVKGPSAVPPAVAKRIDALHRSSEHKRQLPPIAPV